MAVEAKRPIPRNRDVVFIRSFRWNSGRVIDIAVAGLADIPNTTGPKNAETVFVLKNTSAVFGQCNAFVFPVYAFGTESDKLYAVARNRGLWAWRRGRRR